MHYETTDILLASYLLAKNEKMTRHNREGGIVTFRFENKKECAKLSYEFLSGGEVSGTRLFACRDSLINLVKEDKRAEY